MSSPANITLRASDFEDSETAAYRLNQAIAALQNRLTPQRVLADLPFTTNTGGVPSATTIKPPAWPVKSVQLAYAWNLTANTPAYFRIAWSYDSSGQIVIAPSIGDLTNNTSFAMRVELTGA